MTDRDRPRVVQLDDVEALPWRGSELVWRPVRAALDTHVAGISAYTADRTGQPVVEDHVEDADGRGHEEVYLVLDGCARFLLDGVAVDAGRGTFVKVPPNVRRSATALEPGTAVLAMGGPAGFQPAVSEWIERARPWFRSDPTRARTLLDELRQVYGDHPGVDFGEALFAAAQADTGAAVRWLGQAIERSPRALPAARQEPSLAAALGELDRAR